MIVERIDLAQIESWRDFHALFAARLRFPSFYGANMDAWIDCMSDLDGMTEYEIAAQQPLMLVLENAEAFRQRHREIFQALISCTAFVNLRTLATGGGNPICLAYEVP